jgi:hypothetical protein
MNYDPILLNRWLRATRDHALLVQGNAPPEVQRKANNLAKSLLVRILTTVGVSFDAAMSATQLREDEFAEID